MSRRRGQLELPLKTHGGKRRGAGRRPAPGRVAGVSHRARPPLTVRQPAHLTLRVRKDVPSLRKKRVYRVLRGALGAGSNRFGFRLVHFSVQGNHLHLVAEADDATALSRGMQGLAVRVARRLNGFLGRRGSVFADRYHVHVLRTLAEVTRAVRYVLFNMHKHLGRPLAGKLRVDSCSSGATDPVDGGPPTVRPTGWMLRRVGFGVPTS